MNIVLVFRFLLIISLVFWFSCKPKSKLLLDKNNNTQLTSATSRDNLGLSCLDDASITCSGACALGDLNAFENSITENMYCYYDKEKAQHWSFVSYLDQGRGCDLDNFETTSFYSTYNIRECANLCSQNRVKDCQSFVYKKYGKEGLSTCTLVNGSIFSDNTGVGGESEEKKFSWCFSRDKQADTDGDGIADVDDEDDDNDGVSDSNDFCTPGVLNWESNSTTDIESDGCHDEKEDTLVENSSIVSDTNSVDLNTDASIGSSDENTNEHSGSDGTSDDETDSNSSDQLVDTDGDLMPDDKDCSPENSDLQSWDLCGECVKEEDKDQCNNSSFDTNTIDLTETLSFDDHLYLYSYNALEGKWTQVFQIESPDGSFQLSLEEDSDLSYLNYNFYSEDDLDSLTISDDNDSLSLIINSSEFCEEDSSSCSYSSTRQQRSDGKGPFASDPINEGRAYTLKPLDPNITDIKPFDIFTLSFTARSNLFYLCGDYEKKKVNNRVDDTCEKYFKLVPGDHCSYDYDCDGVVNDEDEDDDGDGVSDDEDAFPLDENETIDTDGDGTGDNEDEDDDGDGIADRNDNFPQDESLTNCSEPGDDEYVATVCDTDSGTDTEIEDCSEPDSGEYVTSSCSQGGSSTAGTDTDIEDCSEPGVGEYVSAICDSGDSSNEGTDTSVSDCTTESLEPNTQSPYYIEEDCVAGDFKTLGSNTTFLDSYCGDGTVDSDYNEECDDGDADPNDGCDSTCEEEEGWDCSLGTSCCLLVAYYPDEDGDGQGDSSADPEYFCDEEDGYSETNEDDCDDDPNTQDEYTWYIDSDDDSYGSSSLGALTTTACSKPDLYAATNTDNCDNDPNFQCICGDGIEDPEEACDDENTVDNDGCSSCAIDSGYTCLVDSDPYCSICGDGEVGGEEECDEDSSGCNQDTCEAIGWIQFGGDIDGAEGDYLGSDVSLSADGNILVVTSKYTDTEDLTDAGSVQVFQDSSGTWSQVGQTIYGDLDYEYTITAQISDDGTTLVVGGADYDGESVWGSSIGRVRVFSFSNDSWSQKGSGIEGGSNVHKLGSELDINEDGTRIAVREQDCYEDGEGNEYDCVRVFEYDSDWEQLGEPFYGEEEDDYTGQGLAISSDGSVLAVGASRYT